MIVELHDRFGQPLKVEATRILVRAANGTIVAIHTESRPNHIETYRVGDKDFLNALKRNGVHETVLITDMKSIQP